MTKTTKMSTRKGNTILLQDVLARAHGEVILEQIKRDPEKAAIWTTMIGSFFMQLTEAHKQGEDKVIFLISDYLE